MPTPRSTSVYLNRELAQRLQNITARERRQKIDVIERMLDIYEDLTMVDHAIIADAARVLDLTPGQAVSHMIQTYHSAGIRTPMPHVTEAPG